MSGMELEAKDIRSTQMAGSSPSKNLHLLEVVCENIPQQAEDGRTEFKEALNEHSHMDQRSQSRVVVKHLVNLEEGMENTFKY